MADSRSPDLSDLVSGHDADQADVALAQMLQEQEDAWFAQGLTSPLSTSQRPRSGASTGSAIANSSAIDADPDHRFALEMQQAELRDHVARIAAEQRGAEEGNDVDDMTYEELTALADTVGSVKVGLSQAARSRHLKLSSYGHACKNDTTIDDTCTICQQCYAKEDQIYVLPCKHCFHDECVAHWFEVSKVCPVCKHEMCDSTEPKALN